MRESWSKQKLGDVITLEYGKPLPTDQRCGGNEGFPAFGANGIKCYAREPYWQHSSIIVGRKGTAGAVNLVDGGFWPLDVTYYVTFDDQKYDLKFLYHMLSALNLPALATGVKPGINRNLVYAIEQYFPPLSEQIRIVAILDEAFAGIDTAIANTERNLANARELFESYLNSVFSQRGEGWINTSIGCQMTLQRGFDITKKDQKPGSIPVVSSGGIKSYHDTAKVEAPGVVIGRKGSLGTVHFVENDYWPHDTTLWVKDFKNNNARLVYYFLRSMDLKSLDTGAANPALNRNLVHPIRITWPALEAQEGLVQSLDSVADEAQRLEAIYQQKLTALAEFKQSLLKKAFSGEFTADNVVPIASAKKSSAPPTTDSPAFAAHIMAVAYHWHESRGKNKTFGHVKAQKTLHLVEALAQIDLGRAPVKDAAGPNDFAHMRTAEKWARENDYYDFVQRTVGQRGYDFVKGTRYSEWLARALDAVEPYKSALDRVVNLLMPLDTQKAELVATVYAAWNNLLLVGHKPTEAEIVYEARDNWHPDKQQYTPQQFREAIDRLRSNGMVPTGTSKRVIGQESFEL